MKTYVSIGIILLVLLSIASCKKSEEDKDYNMLKINTGENAGFAHTFYPNMGFWSEVKSDARYVHLVFGSTDNLVTIGKDIMSLLFYYENTGSVDFPSPQAQHANFGVTIDGRERYFYADDATLTISEFTADGLKGNISGKFVSDGPEFEIIDITMDIDIDMTKI
jgi:hypothetical protein